MMVRDVKKLTLVLRQDLCQRQCHSWGGSPPMSLEKLSDNVSRAQALGEDTHFWDAHSAISLSHGSLWREQDEQLPFRREGQSLGRLLKGLSGTWWMRERGASEVGSDSKSPPITLPKPSEFEQRDEACRMWRTEHVISCDCGKGDL